MFISQIITLHFLIGLKLRHTPSIVTAKMIVNANKTKTKSRVMACTLVLVLKLKTLW